MKKEREGEGESERETERESDREGQRESERDNIRNKIEIPGIQRKKSPFCNYDSFCISRKLRKKK